MNCPECNQEFSSRPNLNVTFCLNCNIWNCDNPPKISPTLFCEIIPEHPIPLSEKEMEWGQSVAEKWLADEAALERLK